MDIVVKECFLTHMRKTHVVEATEREIKMEEVSSPKIRSLLLVSAKEREAHE